MSQPYVKTSVLLLGWANDEKDTDTDGEVRLSPSRSWARVVATDKTDE